jgi:CheY-like chemotaxis protein
VAIPLRCPQPEARPEGTAPIGDSADRRKDAPAVRVVLAIDDDPDAVYLLQENVADAGYRVVGALAAEEGLERARALRPFAITLDIMMPDGDGWDVLRALKADPVTSYIPVIVVSVVDEKDQAFRLGAFDHLIKPFERDALLGALERIASRTEDRNPS